MLGLYFNKLKWAAIYIGIWFILLMVFNLFLSAFLSPAFVAVIGMVAIFIVITKRTLTHRYTNQTARREYLNETETFSFKNELVRIIHMQEFLAEMFVHMTLSAILMLIAAGGALAELPFIVWILAAVICIALYTLILSSVDVTYWLIVRYKWFKDREDVVG